MPWIEITSPTPVLNTPDFNYVFGGSSSGTIPLNHLGHPEQFEFVALKNMQFELVGEVGVNIVEIAWPKYSSSSLYLDRRFCREVKESYIVPTVQPSTQSILDHMESKLGSSYIWGGNWADGVPEMLEYYPPKNPLENRMLQLWTLQGLDCSGLLFEATHGASPRNTTHLMKYGRSIPSLENLQPLDMIIYPGHVLFIRDQTTIIESKHPYGVRICSLQKRIEEISEHRTFIPVWTDELNPNSHFVVRRFVEF